MVSWFAQCLYENLRHSKSFIKVFDSACTFIIIGLIHTWYIYIILDHVVSSLYLFIFFFRLKFCFFCHLKRQCNFRYWKTFAFYWTNKINTLYIIIAHAMGATSPRCCHHHRCCLKISYEIFGFVCTTERFAFADQIIAKI